MRWFFLVRSFFFGEEVLSVTSVLWLICASGPECTLCSASDPSFQLLIIVVNQLLIIKNIHGHHPLIPSQIVFLLDPFYRRGKPYIFWKLIMLATNTALF